ncbi:MAG TPA: diguanylate cyclase [Terracidiphilus sp.]
MGLNQIVVQDAETWLLSHQVTAESADETGGEVAMLDRNDLMEAALESFPEGLALLGPEEVVTFWNRAAEKITGYPSMEMVTRPLPEGLDTLLYDAIPAEAREPHAGPLPERGILIHALHRSGLDLLLMTRAVILRDALGERVGKAAIFHAATGVDSLPHGESSAESNLETAQAEIEEQIQAAFEDHAQGGVPLGLLWVTVDQAHGMRKTHGARACEGMLERMERTLTNGLHAAEEIGRWGDDEFLILSHEPSGAVLGAHAQVLAGLARTAEFRWWGDRLSLSVSVGAAQAVNTESLSELLERTQAAMLVSVHAGGNHVTLAPEK